MYAVIMAGGGGTRLWPKSRIRKPKQFQPLFNKDSMIRNTVDRLLPEIPKEKIFIATNVEQTAELKKQIPELTKNIIIEPAIRNTAPCIGLATLLLKEQDEPIAFIASDHYVGQPAKFNQVLKQAAETAEEDFLVLIGIRPTEPETGYGYIKINLKSKIQNPKLNHLVYQVEKFIEKPDLETAKKFVQSGQYLWNGGMFVAKPQVILKLFQKHAPEIYQGLLQIDKEPKNLVREYQKMENISFDYAVVEKAEKIAVVAGEFNWSDIGNWGKLLEILARKENENVAVNCEHYGIETSNCLLHGSGRLIATIGLKDIIVVDTPDAVLVCRKDKAQEVKKIVERLKEEGKKKYL